MRGWPDTGGVDDCAWKQPSDVANAARWLSEQPGVDPERVGLLGMSQGGQVVLLAASLEPSVKAVVAYYPPIDIELWGEEADGSLPGLKDYITSTCAEGVSQAERSPLFAAEEIDAAVLLMHGDRDTRVPIAQSELMLEALLAAGKDAALYRAIGGGHGAEGPGWEGHVQRTLEFFADHLLVVR